MTAAEDKFCDILPNFERNIRNDISLESSASGRFTIIEELSVSEPLNFFIIVI